MAEDLPGATHADSRSVSASAPTANHAAFRWTDRKLLRVGTFVATVVRLFAAAAVVGITLLRWTSAGYLAVDAIHYFDAARRFVDTGTPYLASEVAGPFSYQDLTFLHPPISLYLFVPFAYLPAILWWIVPIAGTIAVIASWRPASWSWPLLLLPLCWAPVALAFTTGNTDLWLVFFLALGLRFGWPALMVVIKPSLVLLALVGARRRSWWYGLVILAVLCAPFGWLWMDWLQVVTHSPGTLAYSLPSLPLLAIPVIARLASARRQSFLPDFVRSGAPNCN